MDISWRIRIMIFTAFAVVIFSDFSANGSVRGVKSDPSEANTAASTEKFQQKNSEFDLNEDTNIEELPKLSVKEKRDLLRNKITDTIKESCLPKMLCEMASKPEYLLTEKEKELMQLIKATAMPMSWNGSMNKWHFAAHMGELLRYTGDEKSGPMGCANLWPNCPISSRKLMKLSYKLKF